MVKIIKDEERAEFLKKRLEEEMTYCDEKTREYTCFEINWDDEEPYWEKIKQKNINLLNDLNNTNVFFLASCKEKIRGKPQLIHETMQRIPVIRNIQKIVVKKGELDKTVRQWKFLDDNYDKRYDGQLVGVLAFDFWVYRVINDGMEYYVFSKEKLNEEYSEFIGMKVSLDDITDISSSLRVKKISTAFICKEASPFVKILPPKELVEFTKELSWDKQTFHDYLFSHPDGNIYDYGEDFDNLRIAQILSSKYEGYPLHLFKMGPVGTGKTTEAEVLDCKFNEEKGILEAGSSRMKVLVPSFKEKPANLGYICNCNRIAIIDELMKMVEDVMNREHINPNNYFSALNMILEHKRRSVGSGNDNQTIVKATAKVCITTNNIAGKEKIHQHLKIIDNTTLSRMLIWCQDGEEIEKIYSKTGIKQHNFREHSPKNKHTEFSGNNFSRETFFSFSTFWDKPCVLGNMERFLTIYDSCQQFLINFDLERVKKIFEMTVKLSNEGMRQVWRARGVHHSVLVLDGLVKYRCLFQDYDPNFKPNDEDYNLLEKILIHMINTWNTNFLGGLV
jgi:hypothetical protein